MKPLRFGHTVCSTLAAACVAASAGAQEHEHGAGSAEKFGTVHFTTSCSQAAQPAFDHAVALLHSFEFARAIAAFNETATTDPGCASAYWGIGVSRWGNPFGVGQRPAAQMQQGREAIDRAKAIGAKTERERAYIDAAAKLFADADAVDQHARILAYRDAMARVVDRFPEDTEASIFYALSLSASEQPTDKTYASRLKA